MLEYLGNMVDVVIDRPLGSKHPEHDIIYPVKYGYIENTVAGDGEEIDAYVLGVFEPIDRFRGRVIAVIRRKNDNESKLVVSKTLHSYSEDQIRALTEFQERFFDIEIVCCSGRAGKPSIRPIVLGLAKRGNEILVEEGYDGIKDETLYRALGGGIEFGEESAEALVRKFKEELGLDISVKDRVCTIENIFTYEEKKGHEIVMVYEIQLSSEAYEKDTLARAEENIVGRVLWMDKNEFLLGKKRLYPEEIMRYL